LLVPRVYLGAIALLLAYGVVVNVALAVFGWRRLYDLLGQDAYNALIPANGMLVVVPGLVLVAIAGLVHAVFRGLVRFRIAHWVALGVAVLVGVPVLSQLPRHTPGEIAEIALHHVLLLAGPVEQDTAYAPGFSEAAFARVRRGMRESDVVALVGQPYRSWTGDPGVSYAQYSWSPGSHSYWQRKLVYRDGAVTRIDESFWFD